MFSAPIEFEGKILDIDPVEVSRRILAAGGEQLGAERLMRRYVYDMRPKVHDQWIRLRDNGNEITLAVKQVSNDAVDGTHETEIVVGNFEDTNTMLGLLGFTPKSYQENRRVSFLYAGARLEIDTWPLISPYLEIEAESVADVHRVAALLGYPADRVTGENTMDIYARRGIDVSTVPALRFSR